MVIPVWEKTSCNFDSDNVRITYVWYAAFWIHVFLRHISIKTDKNWTALQCQQANSFFIHSVNKRFSLKYSLEFYNQHPRNLLQSYFAHVQGTWLLELSFSASQVTCNIPSTNTHCSISVVYCHVIVILFIIHFMGVALRLHFAKMWFELFRMRDGITFYCLINQNLWTNREQSVWCDVASNSHRCKGAYSIPFYLLLFFVYFIVSYQYTTSINHFQIKNINSIANRYLIIAILSTNQFIN